MYDNVLLNMLQNVENIWFFHVVIALSFSTFLLHLINNKLRYVRLEESTSDCSLCKLPL